MDMKGIPGVLEMTVYVYKNSSCYPLKISTLYAHYCIYVSLKRKRLTSLTKISFVVFTSISFPALNLVLCTLDIKKNVM